jgi:osmotically-inducible protein OsmY
VRSTKAFLIGAGMAYLLDPRHGKRRRHVLRDRSLRVVRRSQRLGTKKVKFVSGHLHGLMALVRRLSTRPAVAVDDETVTQRIRSDAFRDVGVSTREVEVEVEDGIATLRGSVDDRSIADNLVTRVGKVPGVRDVAAMLRVSGP